MAPKLSSVEDVPDPPVTAPRIINIDAIIAADLNFIILVETAVPKIFAASFAPRDQPRNKPLDKKNKVVRKLYSAMAP